MAQPIVHSRTDIFYCRVSLLLAHSLITLLRAALKIKVYSLQPSDRPALKRVQRIHHISVKFLFTIPSQAGRLRPQFPEAVNFTPFVTAAINQNPPCTVSGMSSVGGLRRGG